LYMFFVCDDVMEDVNKVHTREVVVGAVVKTALSTVPTQSIRQSRVTGPKVETKGHGGHGSQRRSTNNKMEAKISGFFHLEIKFSPRYAMGSAYTKYAQ
jgi:hypothetical protein